MLVLRWSVALVLGTGAALLVTSVPRTIRIGGFALLGVLVVAAALHLAMGDAPPVSFAVYAAAIWVVRAVVRLRPGTAYAKEVSPDAAPDVENMGRSVRL